MKIEKINLVLPVPENEMNRIISLSGLNIDYSILEENFKDLTQLAARVTGTNISLVNLIDSYTQWTIGKFGDTTEQMPREETVCQYTITNNDFFEVKDLTEDERFKNKFYVTGEPKVQYYLGVPLTTGDGHNIGALCVLDKTKKEIAPEKIELLKIIANEIVNRLKALSVIENLKMKLTEATGSQLKVAHDIRGPLYGITGLAKIISEKGDSNSMEEVLQFIKLIYKSGNSILEMADEILSLEKKTIKAGRVLGNDEINLELFKEKLEKLYSPQAVSKKVHFEVNIHSANIDTPFPKNKLLQIAGNLISNAIKFTPANGKVSVELNLVPGGKEGKLLIVVKDTGTGLDDQSLQNIVKGVAQSTNGTKGEHGYGFGLSLVKHLIDNLKGTLNITSASGEGSTFYVSLPQCMPEQKAITPNSSGIFSDNYYWQKDLVNIN